jgi:hypothetical protein
MLPASLRHLLSALLGLDDHAAEQQRELTEPEAGEGSSSGAEENTDASLHPKLLGLASIIVSSVSERYASPFAFRIVVLSNNKGCKDISALLHAIGISASYSLFRKARTNAAARRELMTVETMAWMANRNVVISFDNMQRQCIPSMAGIHRKATCRVVVSTLLRDIGGKHIQGEPMNPGVTFLRPTASPLVLSQDDRAAIFLLSSPPRDRGKWPRSLGSA